METLQGRISSFKKSKRVKNPTKSSSTTTLKWPHPPEFRANSESLAEAGFYYDPSYDDPDNVTCYICEKELGGWEADDDPFLIHWDKCGQTCCWASARCGLMSDVDGSGRFVSSDKARLPTHKSMEKARLDTFSVGKGWIHDKTPNHGASSKMMARAGFVYTPQHSGDDLATCWYCSTSLSGWDAEDDPLEEHRKRENKSGFTCAFFAVSSSDVASSMKPASRAQSTKPPSKSQSKPPSRSTSRSKHQDVILPTKTFDGDLDGDSDAVPSTIPIQSSTKTPRKGRSTSSSTRKSTAKTPRSKTRSSSRSGLKNVVEEEDDEDDGPLEPQPPVEKKSRSRSKSVAKADVTAYIEPNDDENETRKSSRSRSKKVVSEAEEDISRKSSRSKSKASIEPTANQEEPHKPSRAKSKAKAVESEQEEAPQITAKPKHKRTVSKTRSKAPAQVSEVESEPEPEIGTVAPKKKTSNKPKPPQTPAPQDLFSDDVFVDNYVPPPPSPPLAPKHTSTAELSPLFVPKRNTSKKPANSLEDTEGAFPVKKDQRKPGRPKTKPQPASRAEPSEEESRGQERPPSPEAYEPGAPISPNPFSVPTKTKSGGKSKPGAPGKQKMKVVEISSDEELEELEEDNQIKTNLQQDKQNSRNSKVQVVIQQDHLSRPEPRSRPTSAQAKREKKPVIVETVQPVKPARAPSPSPISLCINPDVSMEYAGPDDDVKMHEAPPVTPPRPAVQVPPSKQEVERAPSPVEADPGSAEPLFLPALSKLPFTPLHALSEAELDMTVEEWIRYQMEVEFDKFRRDGERELQRFRKRAEDVRKVIEGL